MSLAPTLGEALVRAAGHAGVGVRFVDRRERSTSFSWRELLDRAGGVAASLRDRGVGPGDRVAVMGPTGPDLLAAYFGCVLLGALPAALPPISALASPPGATERTRRMLRALGARTLLADPASGRALGADVAVVPLSGHPPRSVAPESRTPGDGALVQFSSGTTLEPRPILLSHRALLAQADGIRRAILEAHPEGAGLRHVVVSWLPLYHDMGLVGCLLTALLHPAPLVLLPPELFAARPASWLRAISSSRGTISAAPDFAYDRASTRIGASELENVDLSSWLVAIDGAEPVAAGTLRRFTRRFRGLGFAPEAFTAGYGLAEAGLAVTLDSLSEPPSVGRFALPEQPYGRIARAERGRELVSGGMPLAGLQVEVRDQLGRALREGWQGDVWVTGPTLMTGYLDLPAATADALVEGWLDTGDRGFFDHGRLFLTGRRKEVILVAGRSLSPEEIESPVRALAGVVAAAALSDDGPGRPATGVVLLVEAHRASRTPELEAAVRRTVLGATGLRCREVALVRPGSLPRTSSGKIRRRDAAGVLVQPPGDGS